MAPVSMSARDARRVQLAAQGLLGRRINGGAAGVVAQTRGIQLDTISVLARSHELIAFARLGAVPRARIEAGLWGGPPPQSFEYWYHAACVLPIDEWPNFAFKREAWRERGFRWHQVDDLEQACKQVLTQLRDRGPLTANELGGAKRGGPWWDWSETKIAAEWLLDIGEIVCTARRSFQRVYDLPERALPDHLLSASVTRSEGIGALARRAAGALGVATKRDLATYIGVKRVDLDGVIGELGLEQAAVEGWKDAAWLGPGALEHPAVTGTTRARPVLLSPFDSLICDRDRLARVFGVEHRLEAYVPQAKRIFGYYSMPVLCGDRIVAKVDPKKEGSTLVARNVHLEQGVSVAGAAPQIADALREAARWVGASDVTISNCPPDLEAPLAAALAR